MKALKFFTCSLILIRSITFGQEAQTPQIPLSPKFESKVNGRPSIDIYGARPLNGPGWGFGFGFYSKPIFLEELTKSRSTTFCIGADMYFLQNVYKELGTMPLLAPQNGNAKVSMTQENFGVNAVARFMFEYSNKITPYIDVFTGVRVFSTDIRIEPIHPQEGYEESTSQNISEVNQWNCGASFGLLYAIGKSAKINIGFMYTTSPLYGQVVNANTARIEGGSISAENMNTPYNTLTLKVGLNFLIPKSNPSCYCDCEGKRGRNIGLGGIFSSWGGGGGLSNSVNIHIGPSK